MRFKYPTPGRVLSRIHEIVSKDQETPPVLTVGYLSDMMIIRANQPVLPVQKIIDNLQSKFPTANVEGGGHEMAGSIRFVNAHRDELIEEVKNMLRNIDNPASSDDDGDL
jgi:RecJ-like exonuclease